MTDSLGDNDGKHALTVQTQEWVIDYQIPTFKDNRNYIEKYLVCDHE